MESYMGRIMQDCDTIQSKLPKSGMYNGKLFSIKEEGPVDAGLVPCESTTTDQGNRELCTTKLMAGEVANKEMETELFDFNDKRDNKSLLIMSNFKFDNPTMDVNPKFSETEVGRLEKELRLARENDARIQADIENALKEYKECIMGHCSEQLNQKTAEAAYLNDVVDKLKTQLGEMEQEAETSEHKSLLDEMLTKVVKDAETKEQPMKENEVSSECSRLQTELNECQSELMEHRERSEILTYTNKDLKTTVEIAESKARQLMEKLTKTEEKMAGIQHMLEKTIKEKRSYLVASHALEEQLKNQIESLRLKVTVEENEAMRYKNETNNCIEQQQTTISDLTKEIEDVKIKLQQSEIALSKAHQKELEAAELQKKLTELSESTAKLLESEDALSKARLEDLQAFEQKLSEARAKEIQYSELQTKFSELMDKFNVKDEILQHTAQKLTESVSKLEKEQALRQHMEILLKRCSDEMKELQQKLDVSQQERKESDLKAADYCAKITQYKSDIEGLQSREMELSKRNTELLKQTSDLETSIHQLEKKLTECEMEKEQARQNNEARKYDADLSSYENRITVDNLQATVDELRKETENNKSKLQLRESELSDARVKAQQVDKLRKTISELKENMDHKTKIQKEYEQKLETITTMLEKAQSNGKCVKTDLKNRSAELETLQKKLDTCRGNYRMKKRKCAESITTLNKYKTKMEELQKRETELSLQNSQLSEQNVNSENKIRLLEEKQGDFEATIMVLEDERKREAEIKESQRQHKKLFTATIAELEKEIAEIKIKWQVSENALSEAEKEARELRNKVAGLTTNLKEKEEFLSSIVQKLAKSTSELEKETAFGQKVKKQFKKRSEELTSTRQCLKDTQQLLDVEKIRLRSQLNSENMKHEETMKDNIRLTQENYKLNELLRKSELDAQEFSEKSSMAEAKIEQIKNERSQAEEKIQELSQQKALIEAEVEQVRKTQYEAEKRIQELLQQNLGYESEIEQRNGNRSQADEQVRNLTEQNANLEAKIEKFEENERKTAEKLRGIEEKLMEANKNRHLMIELLMQFEEVCKEELARKIAEKSRCEMETFTLDTEPKMRGSSSRKRASNDLDNEQEQHSKRYCPENGLHRILPQTNTQNDQPRTANDGSNQKSVPSSTQNDDSSHLPEDT